MKKSLVALAALAATGAFAQSTVTISGNIDMSYVNAKAANGQTFSGIASGATSTSKIIFSGSEDLGGGMRGIFQLEGGINPENGTTNAALFNRHAWVGLAGGFGELTVGRQDTLRRTMNLSNYSDVATEGELSVTTSNSGLQLMQNFGTRVDNAVRYEASISAVNGKLKSLLAAISGQ